MEKLRGGRQFLASLPLKKEILQMLEGSPSTTNSFYLKLKQEIYFELPKSELDHAIKVLRIKIGETIRVLDPDRQILGIGTFVEDKESKKPSIVNIHALAKHEPPRHHMLIGLPEQKTAEEMTEALSAVGVNSICFFYSDKTQNKKIDLDKLYQRLLKKRDSSLKQSFATYAPKICIASSLKQGLETTPTQLNKITFISNNDFAFTQSHRIVTENIQSLAAKKPESSLLILGSEGGFSENELLLLSEKKCSFMSLGKNVLRLEIAASLSLACFNCFNENSDEMPSV